MQRKQNKDSLRNLALYGGLEKTQYKSIESEFCRKNADTLRLAGLTCSVLFLALLLGTFASAAVAAARVLYVSMLLICLAVAVLAFTLVKHRTELAIVLWYVLLLAFGSYAILLNTLFRPELSATTICVFMVAGPLLIIDRPFRVVGFQLLLSVIFVFGAVKTKTPDIAFADSVNLACCVFMGAVIYIRLNRVKLREIMQAQELRKERDIDALTRLLNKAATEERIRDLLQVDRCRQGALIVLDIDNFKHINDTYGHIFGDSVIRRTADCLKDLILREGVFGRFGGDEFVLFLPDLSGEELTEILNTILRGLSEGIVLPDPSETFSVSVGAALMPPTEKDYSELFQSADEALYEAKAAGRNCWRIAGNTGESWNQN